MTYRVSRGCLVSLGIMLLVIVLLWTARGSILPALGGWLDVSGPPQSADYAMLLTGDENTRPFAAAALYNAGWVKHVLVSRVKTVPGTPKNDFLSCNEIIRRVMLQQGVPPEKLVTLPGSATTTFDEAQALAAFIRSSPSARILIVTSHCHTRRARWIFSRVLPPSATFFMISVPSENFELHQWWKSDLGWMSVVGEYFKLGFYCLRYGWWWLIIVLLAGVGGGTVFFRCFRRKMPQLERTFPPPVP